MSGWWLAGAAALAAAFPWLAELRRRPVERLRDDAPGALAALSQGTTHFIWRGAVGRPVAVLVHGLTTPSFVWDEVADRLVARGWRVLCYDLYGRGFSDGPRGVQDQTFFLRQLDDLLADQAVEDGFTLIGYSMGGGIAAGFAAAQPARAGRLVLIAPVGMGHDLGGAGRLVHWPVPLATWAMQLVFPRQFRKATEAERGQPGVPDTVVDGQLAQLGRRGYVGSVLASLRGIISEDFAPVHRALAASGVPVLAIWGGRDATIPIAARDVLERWNPGARHLVLDDAGHAIAYTHADDIAAAIGDA